MRVDLPEQPGEQPLLHDEVKALVQRERLDMRDAERGDIAPMIQQEPSVAVHTVAEIEHEQDENEAECRIDCPHSAASCVS